jgi:hypothetical protein
VEREIIEEKFGKMRCEREIVGENFEKKEKIGERNNKKTWEENFERDNGKKKRRGKKI